MKKGKILIGMVMVTLGILVLSACSGKGEGQKTGNTGQKKENSTDVTQFSDVDGTSWQESWVEKTASGVSVNIDLNAYITIPDLQRMSVVEVERYGFTEKNKKAMLEGIFGGEVYLPGKSVKLKEGGYKGKSYLGDRDGIRYQFSYDTYHKDREEAVIRMELYEDTAEDVMPDSMKGYELSGVVEGFFDNQAENQCKMTKEKAEETAKEFLSKAGFPDLVKTGDGVMTWCGGKENSDETKMVTDGWSFTYSPGIEGAAFTDSGIESDSFTVAMDGAEKNPQYIYSMDCSVHVCVSDRGVVQAVWNNPVRILSSVPGVKLLPFDTIKNIVRNQMTEFAEYCYKQNNRRAVSMDRMELVYCRVSDPDSRDKFTYVPAWRLRANSGGSVFLVNAMDGSLIREWNINWGELKMW